MDSQFNKNVIRAKTHRAQEKRGILSGGKTPTGKIAGSGPANRHGMPQLPPGQREVVLSQSLIIL